MVKRKLKENLNEIASIITYSCQATTAKLTIRHRPLLDSSPQTTEK
jgi:hypothetical protein